MFAGKYNSLKVNNRLKLTPEEEVVKPLMEERPKLFQFYAENKIKPTDFKRLMIASGLNKIWDVNKLLPLYKDYLKRL